MKTAALAPFALVLGTLALGACDSQQKQAAAPNPRPDAPEGITITDGRLVLPAVAGNPGAVYFTVHNDSASAATITGARVKGAGEAMIHRSATTDGVGTMEMVQQVAVPAMGKLEFKPGGLHVMAMDLDESLAKGVRPTSP
jgi:copper(I)-binding protein